MPTDDVQVVVEMFPAQHGDAFLVRVLAAGSATNILVDAGPLATYRNVLRPRLRALASAGENLRALIVTHIDADHIEGAIEFLEDNGESATPAVIGVQDVWHNSYRHLLQAGAAPTPDQVAQIQRQVPPRVQTGSSSISARQGSTLAAILRRHHYPWNAAFDGQAAATDGRPRRHSLDSDLHLTLLSPRHDDLAGLSRMWRRELLSLGVPSDLVDAAAFEEAFERVIERESEASEDLDEDAQISVRDLIEPLPPSDFREDRSAPNASSIAFLLEAGEKRVLFLGDARPSTIVAHLRALTIAPVEVAALKVSHHGSKKNTSPDLCSAIRATHGLISTDGSKHGHPDVEALLWLVSSQPGINLHFNYPTPTALAIARPDLLQRFGHTVSIAPSSGTYVLTL